MLPSDWLTRRPWVTISACQSSAAPVPEVPIELAGGDTWKAPILARRSPSLGRRSLSEASLRSRCTAGRDRGHLQAVARSAGDRRRLGCGVSAQESGRMNQPPGGRDSRCRAGAPAGPPGLDRAVITASTEDNARDGSLDFPRSVRACPNLPTRSLGDRGRNLAASRLMSLHHLAKGDRHVQQPTQKTYQDQSDISH